MREVTIAGTDMNLVFTGPNGPYTTFYTAEFVDETTLFLEYTIEPGIEGG